MSQPEIFRSHAPAPLQPRPIVIPAARETVLSNGLTIVVVEDGRLPLISYRLAFRVGGAFDPPGLPGLTDLLAGLLPEGTESRTSREIAEEVARMGASLSAGATSDYTIVGASALSQFNDKILGLMAEVVLQPSFPEIEVDLAKQNTKESLRQQRAQPSFLASEMVSRVMYGDHPYAIVAPSIESIDRASREEFVRFHRANFVPNNAVFIVVGDVNYEQIVQQLESLFSTWGRGADLVTNFPVPPVRTTRAAYVVDRRGSAQSNIVVANSGIVRTSPDYFPMLLMHTVLGANASSRLFMNLREEKGYTYGAYTNLDARRTAGTFRATAEVRTPVTGDSLKEFFYELDRIRNEVVSDKEISDAKSYLTGVFPIRLETQEGLTDQLVQIKMLNLPGDYLQHYRDRVQAVSAAEIQRVASKYVRPDEAAVIVVGDGTSVLEQIKPYCEDIEVYTTSGKRKSLDAPATTDLAGSWSIEVETPLGQNIPATLTLERQGQGFNAKILSDMGNADLGLVELNDNSFHTNTFLEMDGHKVAAEIDARFNGDQLQGSLKLQNSPSLPFTGSKDE
ncbi:MAG TPA: pitrilysin family protein [Pyrinomonadaceae bacterium]|jgi:zinc protease|nr:pitrilysin family protein [Pyrinomonadaceae bacterium]